MTIETLKARRVQSLPGSPVANTIYFVDAGSNTFNLYVTNNDGTIVASALVDAGDVPAGGTPGQVLAKASATDYDTEWVTALPKTTGNLNLYVDADAGNDSNDGLTALTAFETIQAAINYAASLYLDHNCTINLALNTTADYTAHTLKTLTGPGLVIIQGNESAPTEAVISGAGIVVNTLYGGRGQYYYYGVTFSGNTGVHINGNFYALIRNCQFETAVNAINTLDFGAARLVQTNTFNNCTGRWFNASRQSKIISYLSTAVFDGTCAFSTGVAVANHLSFIDAFSMTLTVNGTVTGKRYDSQGNSYILVAGGGATYFPGSISGTTATGGLYL